jgi:hypothetical protein
MGWSMDKEEQQRGGRKKRHVRYVDKEVIMKRTIFGGFVGGVTGSLLAMSDAYRTKVPSPETTSKMMTRMIRAAPIGGVVLGTFFAAYNCGKYTLDYNLDKTSEVEFLHSGAAAVASLAPLVLVRSLRRHTAYAAVLIALDIAGEQGLL